MKRLIAVVLACLCVSTVTTNLTGEDAAQADRKAAHITQLIQKLSDVEQTQREASVSELKKLGSAVVGPLTETAFGDDAEAGILAVSILEDLQQSEANDVVTAAENALQKIRDEGRAHVARRAEAAWDRNFETRQRRAVIYIEQHHGSVWRLKDVPSRFQDPGTQDLPHTIIIGKDWTGGDTALQHIARLDSVHFVYLTKGHSISEASLAEFRRVRPQVQISQRGAGFLGVSHGPHNFGCQVGSVKPGTPAEEAGLEMGDIIVEFGGIPTRTPDDLIDAISNFAPGDEIEVIVLRDPLVRRGLNGFGRWSLYEAVLGELLQEEEPESVLLSIAVLHSMKTKITVKLGLWTSPK